MCGKKEQSGFFFFFNTEEFFTCDTPKSVISCLFICILKKLQRTRKQVFPELCRKKFSKKSVNISLALTDAS